ncbi:hypothetical protein Tsubulata_000600 [Turnera subulata]|uniref:Uncharacterized protein n=1 Tax=Turnera subulata TaxID=218843 RepID=A0A9Q0JR71_9ROSI|nr:hypothetical protein Tsubulata_000600 [Turnera subulata]
MNDNPDNLFIVKETPTLFVIFQLPGLGPFAATRASKTSMEVFISRPADLPAHPAIAAAHNPCNDAQFEAMFNGMPPEAYLGCGDKSLGHRIHRLTGRHCIVSGLTMQLCSSLSIPDVQHFLPPLPPNPANIPIVITRDQLAMMRDHHNAGVVAAANAEQLYEQYIPEVNQNFQDWLNARDQIGHVESVAPIVPRFTGYNQVWITTQAEYEDFESLWRLYKSVVPNNSPCPTVILASEIRNSDRDRMIERMNELGILFTAASRFIH